MVRSEMSGRIRSGQDLVRFLRSDFASKYGGETRLSCWVDPIWRFMVALRFNEYLLNSGIPLSVRALPLLYFRRLSIRLGFTIPLNVFDEGLAIVHVGTIVVSPLAQVGRNCRIHVCTNIGATLDPQQRSVAPQIEDDCYIGPGAKIYGPIVIGSGCRVGANAVVGRSFPANSFIAGVPARLVSRNES